MTGLHIEKPKDKVILFMKHVRKFDMKNKRTALSLFMGLIRSIATMRVHIALVSYRIVNLNLGILPVTDGFFLESVARCSGFF